MKYLDPLLTTGIIISGIAMIGAGAYAAYPPAAPIAVGCLLLGIVILSKVQRRRKPE